MNEAARTGPGVADGPEDDLPDESLRDIAAAIEEIRRGRMIVLIDDEDRENEGDLVIAAECADKDAINFMAKYGRGLICLALTQERVDALGLPLMPSFNASRFSTAFTVSIEAREGVTTGISAQDRAHTIQTAIDPRKTGVDLASPGHVFPLAAREGGVLIRAGHTEAAVDIARLAGRAPAGVICEIMNDDGSMARRPDLLAFAETHDLRIATIADLIAYRRRMEKLVRKTLSTDFDSLYGGRWVLHVYENTVTGVEHLALIKGDIAGPGAVPVRMHAMSVLDDVLCDAGSGRAGELARAMRMIAAEGRGAVVLLRDPSGARLEKRLRGGVETPGSNQLRDYGAGAQILLDLGIREMILLSNNPKTIIGLDGYGLRVAGRRPITDDPDPSTGP